LALALSGISRQRVNPGPRCRVSGSLTLRLLTKPTAALLRRERPSP
jgi:hypothetical protein